MATARPLIPPASGGGLPHTVDPRVRNQAQAARAAGVKLGRRDVVRVAQLLINDAESRYRRGESGAGLIQRSAHGHANGKSRTYRSKEPRQDIYKMRTAADVWAGG